MSATNFYTNAQSWSKFVLVPYCCATSLSFRLFRTFFILRKIRKVVHHTRCSIRMTRTHLEGRVPQNLIATIFKDGSTGTQRERPGQLARHPERIMSHVNQLMSVLVEFANSVLSSLKKNG